MRRSVIRTSGGSVRESSIASSALARSTRWRAENKDKKAEYNRIYREKNKDKKAEYNRIYREQNKEKLAAYMRQYGLAQYGLTLEEYEAMLDEQIGVCAICKTSGEGNLAVDHDHKTGKIRGLLCKKCNSALGFFGDDYQLVKTAESYMRP